MYKRYLSFFLTVLWSQADFRSYSKRCISRSESIFGIVNLEAPFVVMLCLWMFLLVRPRIFLNLQGHQRGSFKYMVALSVPEIWLKTRIQRKCLTKYVQHFRILFLSHFPIRQTSWKIFPCYKMRFQNGEIIGNYHLCCSTLMKWKCKRKETIISIQNQCKLNLKVIIITTSFFRLIITHIRNITTLFSMKK